MFHVTYPFTQRQCFLRSREACLATLPAGAFRKHLWRPSCWSFRTRLRKEASLRKSTVLAPLTRRLQLSLFGLPERFVRKSKSPVSAESSVATELTRDRVKDPTLAKYWDTLLEINALEAELEQLKSDELRARLDALRRNDSVRSGDPPLAEVFAIVREAARRTLSMRPFDVQVLGGLALFHGCVAEIATGEGKTLIATMPACASALAARGTVLVVTVNDYLCRRDFENMGPLYRSLGFSVGCVTSATERAARQRAYACDITYVTNAELGFDYLRDHLVLSAADQVLVTPKPFYFCLLDEADSIMIDEARTPLIISQAAEAPTEKYATAAKLAANLQRDRHYTVYEKERNVTLTGAGYEACEEALQVPTLFAAADPWAPFVLNALKAKELYQRDIDYVVRGDQVLIVDEFTGRVLQGRRWSEGLHQAIEAKEGLAVRTEPRTVASISYQSFFRLFPRLAGMTGTAATDAAEIRETYGLEVVVVPTALPVVRRDYPDVVFRTSRGKLLAVVAEIRRLHLRKVPVLVGTTSIEASERISALLSEGERVPHEVLNARPENAERESEIIAQAGRLGAVTIATNMAGRGTDIVLGGNVSSLARALLQRELLATFALGPECSSGAGDRASTEHFLSCLEEAEHHQLHCFGEKIAEALRSQRSTDPGPRLIIESMEQLHQLMLQAAEFQEPTLPFSAEAQELVREALQWLEKQLRPRLDAERAAVLDLGGLHILGTERHESRRIDNQLRGRAGRQGDPGCSRFFLSLEDPIFRVFGGDRMARLAEAFRLDETTPIESVQVARTLDNVQRSIEQYYAGIRKQLFAYDEVLSQQRKVLYRQRNRFLEADEALLFGSDAAAARASGVLAGLAGDWIRTTIQDILQANRRDPAKCVQKLKAFFPGALLNESMCQSAAAIDQVAAAVGVRLSQHRRMLQQSAPQQDVAVFRYLALVQHDQLWSEHLRKLALLRDMSSLQTLRQVDPLQQYQQDSFQLFEQMMAQIRRNTVYSFFKYSPGPTVSA
jgi:preprotein translocase subunit SecA